MGVNSFVSSAAEDVRKKLIDQRQAKGGTLANNVNQQLKDNQVEAGKAAGGTNRRVTGLETGLAGATGPSLEDLYRQQYELAEKRRKARLDATINANNQAADRSLNDAYIAYMLQQRNLPQQLRANGINGGATETTLGDMNNTYMNNRYNIMANRDNANAQARLAYDDGLAGDYGTYLNNRAALAMANNTSGQSVVAAKRTPASYLSDAWDSLTSIGQPKTQPVPGYGQTQAAPISFDGAGWGFGTRNGINLGVDDAIVTRMQQLMAQGYSEDQIRKMLGY